MAIQRRLAEDCVLVELGDRVSGITIPGWPTSPTAAAVLPIRLRDASEAAGFLVLGTHPGRAFDDAYRHFVRRIAEQIAVGLASARAYEREHSARKPSPKSIASRRRSSATSATSSVRRSR